MGSTAQRAHGKLSTRLRVPTAEPIADSAPLSRTGINEVRTRNAVTGGLVGTFLGALLGGPTGALIGLFSGGLLGNNKDPES